MTRYSYNNVLNIESIETFDADVRLTSLTATYLGSVWNQGCNTVGKELCNSDCIEPCNGLLVCVFSEELSTADKETLDGIVDSHRGA